MISIVVPVYNVEKYLVRCLDSILAQTYKNWECILVDDESSDGSGRICDIYAERDDRFYVMHKSNSGANLSRKEGFKIARGEYITFIDSDDYLESTMLEKLISVALLHKNDMVICEWYVDNDNKSKHIQLNLPYNSISKKDILEKYIVPSVWGMPGSIFIPCFLWCRIVKKSLVSEWMFVSEREYLPEDLILQLNISLHVESVGLIREPLYHYCVNDNSLTTGYTDCAFKKRINCYNYVKKFCVSNHIWLDEVRHRMDWFILCAANFVAVNSCLQDKYGYIMRNLHEVFSNTEVQRVFNSRELRLDSFIKRFLYLSYRTKIFLPFIIYIKIRYKRI